jgi:hypothetical protein
MTRSPLLATLGLLAIGLLAAADLARADEIAPAPPPTPSTAPLSAEDILELCDRLGAADYAVREEATQQLISEGRAVIDSVAATADADNLEVAVRCLRILKELYDRPNEETKQAARSALETLSKSRHRAAARRAAFILNPPEVILPRGRQGKLWRVNAKPRMGAINAARAEVVGGGSRIQITNRNGDVTIDAEEGGRKVTISHHLEEDIVIRVREPPAVGEKQGKTSEYRARDAGELKDKHPEAHRLFERYNATLRRAGGP